MSFILTSDLVPGKKHFTPKEIISKEESLYRYGKLKEFLDVLGLYFEPALKSTRSEIYHASSVFHTRIIDLDPNRLSDRIYNQIKNHDGYKQPHYLIRSEQYDMKPLGFVQAMKPTIFVTNRKQKVYLEIQRLRKELDAEFSYSKHLNLDELQRKYIYTNNCFNNDDFLHFRYWFFDLDYPERITSKQLIEELKNVGIFPFINAIVETSPGKFHLYIKSEMIATKEHVKNWPLALGAKTLSRVTDPEYLESLNIRYPKKTGMFWNQVGMRGLPSIHSLDTIPIPIPEDARLQNGLYCGDDNVYDDYLGMHKEITNVLGGDPSVCNETRNAQLVGYTNPKSKFTATMVYANKEAPVLTTRYAKTVLHDNLQRYKAANPFPIWMKYQDNHRQEEERFVREFFGVTEKKQKAKRGFSKLPTSPEDYCRIHGLMDSVLWDKDITGHSNEMLLLFSKFAHKHIDLTNTKQQILYFETIIETYLKNRISKDLKKENSIDDFFDRFKDLCKHNSKTLASNRSNIETQTKYLSSLELQQIWLTKLKEVAKDHSCIYSAVHRKLRAILCDYAVSYSSLNSENGVDILTFQIPSALLKNIFNYKEKLKVYTDLGFYSIGKEYIVPFRKGGCVIKAGQCKKHKLILNTEEKKVQAPIDVQSTVVNETSIQKETPEVIVGGQKVSPVILQMIAQAQERKALEAAKAATIEKPVIKTFTPTPIQDISELEAEPSKDRILTMDYVMSVVKAQPLVDNEAISNYSSIELPILVDEKGYSSKTLTNLPSILNKDIFCYDELCQKFKEDVSGIITEQQLENDYYADAYLIKRAKILNNLRPFKAHEMALLSKEDRKAYLFAVADLISLPTVGREYSYGKIPVYERSLDYYLDFIEGQVVQRTFMFRKLDLNNAKMARWLRRELKLHLSMVDYIYTNKQKYHKEFYNQLDEDIEVYWRVSSCLNRDRINRNFNNYLSPKLLEQYELPVALQLEENKYHPLIENIVNELVRLHYALPYDHKEKNSLAPFLTCKCESIRPILKQLKDCIVDD